MESVSGSCGAGGFCCAKSVLAPSAAGSAAKAGASGVGATPSTAGGTSAAPSGAGLVTAKTYGYEAPIKGNINTIVGNLIKKLLPVIGALMLAMFIWGGFLWTTAGGDEGQVKKAKAVLSGAMIGMIIIVGAYVIVTNIVTILGRSAFSG